MQGFTVVLDESHAHLLRFFPFSKTDQIPGLDFSNYGSSVHHGSLWMLMDTLLDKETLNSWNIYEEKSGAVVVRIRFSPRHIWGGSY